MIPLFHLLSFSFSFASFLFYGRAICRHPTGTDESDICSSPRTEAGKTRPIYRPWPRPSRTDNKAGKDSGREKAEEEEEGAAEEEEEDAVTTATSWLIALSEFRRIDEEETCLALRFLTVRLVSVTTGTEDDGEADRSTPDLSSSPDDDDDATTTTTGTATLAALSGMAEVKSEERGEPGMMTLGTRSTVGS
jgi:hypothetical protein